MSLNSISALRGYGMKRKRYPKNFKEQLIKEVQEVGNAVSVAKRHGINAKTLYRWIHESKHKAWEKTDGNAKKITTYVPSPQEFKRMENEVDCPGISMRTGTAYCWH